MIKRIKRVRSDRKAKSKSKSMTPAPARRFRLFGQPQILEGEDAAAYDELLARICDAIKPVDTLAPSCETELFRALVAHGFASRTRLLLLRVLKQVIGGAPQCTPSRPLASDW